jgi:signal transduction histidine kinase
LKHQNQKFSSLSSLPNPLGEGTILGLSLAYDIITKGLSGTIEVESKEGVGTEFIISLNL